MAGADEANGTDTKQLSWAGETANCITLCALFIYMFALLGGHSFKPSFFHRLACVFQLIRILLTFSILLPAVLHWQAFFMMPAVTKIQFPFVVIAALALNICVATTLRKLNNKYWSKLPDKEKMVKDENRLS